MSHWWHVFLYMFIYTQWFWSYLSSTNLFLCLHLWLIYPSPSKLHVLFIIINLISADHVWMRVRPLTSIVNPPAGTSPKKSDCSPHTYTQLSTANRSGARGMTSGVPPSSMLEYWLAWSCVLSLSCFESWVKCPCHVQKTLFFHSPPCSCKYPCQLGHPQSPSDTEPTFPADLHLPVCSSTWARSAVDALPYSISTSQDVYSNQDTDCLLPRRSSITRDTGGPP